MIKTLRATRKATLFFIITALMAPIAILLNVFSKNASGTLIRSWHRIICWALTVDVIVTGTDIENRANAYIANHCSYIDITVMGGLLNGNFIAKSAIADWPLIGTLAKIAGTLFIEKKPHHAGKHISMLEKSLNASEKLIFFPEGTSTEGRKVMPFKPSLFQPFMADDSLIQPITLAYFNQESFSPLSDAEVEQVAWLTDDGFFSHLWQFLKHPGITVVMELQPAVSTSQFADRKALALKLQRDISMRLLSLYSATHDRDIVYEVGTQI